MNLAIRLTWPSTILSPNARAHWGAVSSAKKAAKDEAHWTTKIALGRNQVEHSEGKKIGVRVEAHPPKAWRTGDEDNLAARLKYHFDAIANALGVNDRDFRQDGVAFEDRDKSGPGYVIIHIEIPTGDAGTPTPAAASEGESGIARRDKTLPASPNRKGGRA